MLDKFANDSGETYLLKSFEWRSYSFNECEHFSYVVV